MHFYIIILTIKKLINLKINQMKHSKLIAVMAAGIIVFSSCKKDGDGGYGGHSNPPPGNSQVFSSAGDLTNVLIQFRTILGDPNNTTPGQTVGRREVNWEGIPSANVNNN